jgi:hypothetical protein
MPALTIEELAKEIYDKTLSKVKETDRYGIDPITIIMIIAIMVNVIRVIQECNKNKQQNYQPEKKQNFLAQT